MHDLLIEQIVAELRGKLIGRFLGKVFQLGPLSVVIDFGIKGGEYLYISVEPSSPRMYLIKRRLKDLEKQSIPSGSFLQLLRAKLESARVKDIKKIPDDRVVYFSFQRQDAADASQESQLVVQLTGRSANLLLLHNQNMIVETLRTPRGEGQNVSEIYQPPPHSNPPQQQFPALLDGESPSAAAEAQFREIDSASLFDTRVNRLRGRLQQKLKQKRKLNAHLQNDLASHGDPEEHKRIGDLLLANLGTAVRRGSTVDITDYYNEGGPTISVEIEETNSLQDEASRRFRQYSKAKRARKEIAERLSLLNKEIAALETEDEQLRQVIANHDESALINLEAQALPATKQIRQKSEPARLPGVRHYVSTDGYEILVGRAARDNDNLTFRIARPNDLWLHAADYPGSHVVVRNPTRKEIPQRTMIEAAQLAGKFSQAGDDTKVVVHYTPRKFLSKPKGAAPGLVRMSTFKSITIEPKEAVSRVR
jgi:predicted ribosome quality control (RQC) complex YloA/Tae2 family protein